MSKNENQNAKLDEDHMIQHAASLQRVAMELDQSALSIKDPLLFEGTSLAVPIVLSLATEIALKAFQCRERQGKPERTHDLLRLFDGLEQETRNRIEAEMPEVSDPLGRPPIRPGLREVLSFHAHAFEHYRYLYEDFGGVFKTPELDQVLTAIIQVYEDMLDD